MLMKDDGVVLYFDNYKTKRITGRDELALQVRFLVFPRLFVRLFFFKPLTPRSDQLQTSFRNTNNVCINGRLNGRLLQDVPQGPNTGSTRSTCSSLSMAKHGN